MKLKILLLLCFFTSNTVVFSQLSQQALVISDYFYKWNSTMGIWENTHQTNINYNTKGEEVFKEIKHYFEDWHKWELVDETKKEYDDEGNIVRQTSTYYEYWKDGQAPLEINIAHNEMVATYNTFNQAERVRRTESYEKEGEIVYKQTFLNIHTYDENGCWLGVKTQVANDDEPFRNTNRSVRTVNDQCQPINIIFYVVENNAFLQSQKYMYEYNAQNQLRGETHFSWDRDSSDWVLSVSVNYQYDADGNEIERYTDYVNYQDNRIRKTYTASGQIATDTYEYYDTNQWVLQSKYSYEYNGRGDVEKKIFDWHQPNGNQIQTTAIYTYDIAGKLIMEEWIEYFYENGTLQNIMEYEKEYINRCDGTVKETLLNFDDNQGFYEDSKHIYEYATVAACESFIPEMTTLVTYPNPTTDIVYIESPILGLVDTEVSIMDMKGSIVTVETAWIGGRYKLNVGHLRSGVYTIVLRNGNRQVQEKFIKIEHP